MQLKKILIVLITFLSINVSVSQIAQHDLNHRRYWFYRTRFINDFVKIGPNQGDCISFPQRNYGSLYSPIASVGPDQIDQMNMYLAALALEYKILKRNNQDVKETLKEIFYIIDTYNRLDEEADQFWNTTPPQIDYPLIKFSNDRNGFILREDMPQQYFDPSSNTDNYLHFNYAKKEYNNTLSNTQWSYSGLPEVNTLDFSKFNDYVGFNSNNHSSSPVPKTGLSIPHDKYHSMFFAFMFIVKYLPDNLAYVDENNITQTFSDGETSIKKEVRNITNRCLPYLRGNLFGNPASNWTTEYPDGSNTQNLGSPLPFSYPLVNMICHINNNFPWNYPCLGNSDAVSLTAGPNSYIFLSSSIFLVSATNAVLTLMDNNTLTVEDMAVFLAYDQASSNVYPGAMPLWLKMQQNTSFFNLEWADLARKVLHQDGIFTKQKSVYEAPLNQAHCKGPFNFSNCIHAGCEWSATDRMEHPSRRNAGCTQFFNCNTVFNSSSLVFRGNYPGVDYMLLHNLYYEHLNQKHDQNSNSVDNQNGLYKNAYNLMDNYDEQIWPIQTINTNGNFQQNITIGVDANVLTTTNPPGPTQILITVKQPAKIKLFQNLSSRAQIYATTSPAAPNNLIPSKVEYRAGKEITLLPENPSTNAPGFEVKAGSDFYAYIKRYVCGLDDYTNGMRQGSNGEEVHSTDYESDEMNSEIPIHYVEYTELSDADKFPVVNEINDQYYPEILPGQNIDETHEEALIQNLNQVNNIDNTLFENIKRFEVLPNPSTGIFKVVTNKIDQNEVLNITIIDMKGITVYSNADFKTTEIDLSPYARGIYMLHMNSSLGRKYSKRLSLVE
jgi:hypothetical protein